MICDVLQLCKERAATIDKQYAVALEEMRSIKSIIHNDDNATNVTPARIFV